LQAQLTLARSLFVRNLTGFVALGNLSLPFMDQSARIDTGRG